MVNWNSNYNLQKTHPNLETLKWSTTTTQLWKAAEYNETNIAIHNSPALNCTKFKNMYLSLYMCMWVSFSLYLSVSRPCCRKILPGDLPKSFNLYSEVFIAQRCSLPRVLQKTAMKIPHWHSIFWFVYISRNACLISCDIRTYLK